MRLEFQLAEEDARCLRRLGRHWALACRQLKIQCWTGWGDRCAISAKSAISSTWAE
jgi:hypothetical protein